MRHRSTFTRLLVILLLTSLVVGCASAPEPLPEAEVGGLKWSIAIHAGAGVIDKDTPKEEVEAYEQSLREALEKGRAMLAGGATALDTAEAVVMMLENNPLFNAGKGAVFNAKGGHELDSSIMDGATLQCGAVAGVTTIKNPIRLARRVMEKTRHVLLAGAGAEAFANTQSDIERVEQSYYYTEKRFQSLQRKLERMRREQSRADVMDRDELKSTVGCVALDFSGNLAAATSTGGMTAKKWGRVGDSPVIGAGTYAANDTCAVSCTGTGEEYIRHGVARDVADRMRYLKVPLAKAAKAVIFEILQPDDGGLIAVDKYGNISMPFNTPGMFRGAANAAGRFEIAIW